MEKEQTEETLQGQEAQKEETQEQPVTEAEPQKEVSGEASPATVEVLGRQYDLSNQDQVQDLIKDYDRLGRMYSPLLQQVRDLQVQLQEFRQKREESPEEEIDETTLNYIKKAINKLEIIKQAENLMDEKLRRRDEDQWLENYLSSLEIEYDGSNGLPKFDRSRVLRFCFQHGISDPLMGYKLMHQDQLIEAKLRQAGQTKTPPPSAPSTGERRIPSAKKRVFGMTRKEDEVSLRDAIEETLKEASGGLAEE